MELQKAKGPRTEKLIEKYYAVGKELADKFYKLAEANSKDQVATDALLWVVQNGEGSPVYQKSVNELMAKHPDHASLERVCMMLSRGRTPDAEKALKTIAEKAAKPNVKAAATLSLAKLLASRTDSLGDKPAEADKVAAEAEKLFAKAIELYKDNAAQKKAAETELNALKTLRVGKVVPEIKAADLDGKEFKLSDYRGKVVMLDFWGNCEARAGPCSRTSGRS